MTDEIKALAQRVWPNAKRIDVSLGAARHSGFAGRDAESVRVIAFGHDDQIIAQASAETTDALKEKLEHKLPQGGQAP